MCVGWWLGFTVLTVGLGLRMTPPRGDNWSGALGMTAALFLFSVAESRVGNRLERGWLTGLFGGLGFSGADTD